MNQKFAFFWGEARAGRDEAAEAKSIELKKAVTTTPLERRKAWSHKRLVTSRSSSCWLATQEDGPTCHRFHIGNLLYIDFWTDGARVQRDDQHRLRTFAHFRTKKKKLPNYRPLIEDATRCPARRATPSERCISNTNHSVIPERRKKLIRRKIRKTNPTKQHMIQKTMKRVCKCQVE